MNNYWDTYSNSIGAEAKMQESFKAMVQRLSDKIKKDLEDSIGEIEQKFMPFLFEDTLINLRNHCTDALLAECNKDLRDKVWSEHKQEIIDAGYKELEAERDKWKQRYENCFRRL